jgi:ABC-2 type transport system ATP-binding protein
VSFAVQKGEILGLVGPNGAGKTTTIRMLMDIVKPDSGEISIFGRRLDEDAKNRIGYLPEERGLYRKMKVSDSLVYLASLKNVPSSVAKEKSETLLKQVDMYAHRGKKVNELSRGMGQIIQFLVTIAHNPDLVVLDEPFSGLDPVNRMLLKNIILELKAQGKSVILSTHMMNEVEEMCDRIIMIDKGRVVLYGDLSEIKWRFRNNSVFVKCDGDVSELSGVSGRKDHGKYIELFLDGRAKPQDILDQLIAKHVRIDRFEVSTPSLNEIFIQVAKHE